MHDDLHVRSMIVSDLVTVHQLEQSVTPYPWTHQQLQDSLSNHHCFVLIINQQLIGFMIFSEVLDEFTLLNIAISPSFTRQGYGFYLLRRGLLFAKQQQAQECFLEVRVSNAPAINLYERLGFQVVGERKNYYPCSSGREDALVMKLAINDIESGDKNYERC